jgi:hypothetical protein
MPSSLPRRLLVQFALMGVALAFLLWRAWPDGQLHMWFPALRGDAALVQLPSGGYLLIDGGADPAALTAFIGRRLPFWQHQLEAVVLTANHSAALPGQVAVLERYHARQAWLPARGKGTLFAEWSHLLKTSQTPIRLLRPDQPLRLDGVTLRTLALDQQGNAVLRLDYGSTSVVWLNTMPNDLPKQALRPASLVVFPWEYDPRLPTIEALRPRAMLFSDGLQADRPVELTFSERAIANAALYHEQINGTVEWISNGRTAQIIAER